MMVFLMYFCATYLRITWFSKSKPFYSTLQSESESDSLVALFSYKPLDGDLDWSLVAKASPCYVTVRWQFVLINYHHHYHLNM